MPGNCAKFFRATKAHSDARIITLDPSGSRTVGGVAMCLRSMEELSTVTGHNVQTKLGAVLAFANMQVSVQIRAVLEHQ